VGTDRITNDKGGVKNENTRSGKAAADRTYKRSYRRHEPDRLLGSVGGEMSEARDCLSCYYFKTEPDQKPCSVCLEHKLNQNCYKPKSMRKLAILTAVAVLIFIAIVILVP